MHSPSCRGSLNFHLIRSGDQNFDRLGCAANVFKTRQRHLLRYLIIVQCTVLLNAAGTQYDDTGKLDDSTGPSGRV